MKGTDTEMRSDQNNNTQTHMDNCDCSYADTLTFASLLTGKFSNNTLSSVYAACEKIANALACMPLRVVKESVEGHQEILHGHPLQKIFRDRGTQTVSMFMTMKNAILDTLKKGNGYIYINRADTGDVLSFRYLDASSVTIMYNEKTDTLYYLAPTVIKGKIMPNQILHFVKNTKGTGGVEGISVLTYARDVIALAKAAEEQAKSFFESGCNVSGILSAGPGTNLSNLQREQLRSSWAIKGNKSSIQVLPSNVQYVPIGTDASKA